MDSGEALFLFLLLMSAFGLALLILPNTLVRLYRRLSQSEPPRPVVYRIIGAVACALAVRSFWLYYWR